MLTAIISSYIDPISFYSAFFFVAFVSKSLPNTSAPTPTLVLFVHMKSVFHPLNVQCMCVCPLEVGLL